MIEQDFDNDLCCEILDAMADLRKYFVKFNRGRADEAMQKTLHHALAHYYSGRGDLAPYLKKLARTILSTRWNDSPYEHIEEVVKGYEEHLDSALVHDCSELESFTKINELALYFMPYFLLLCNSFSNRGTNTRYFPKEFKKECIRLIKINENFNDICNGLYDKHGVAMQSFLALDGNKIGEWRETDYSFIKSYISKRVHFVNSAGEPILGSRLSCSQNLDELRWQVKGKLANKKVVRVRYIDLWDFMCDEIASEDNSTMRFSIGDTFIIRTLGGSWTVVNPNLDNVFELCLDEIITNLLYMTSGRYIGRGTENLYFLVDKVKDLSDKPIKAMGVDICLYEEDITDIVQSRIYTKQ